jgi:ABC-type transport system substrate-binding protein
MRQRNNYWVRQFNSNRLSRRRFMGGTAAVGAGAAGLALVGCGDDDVEDLPTPTSPPTNGDPTPTPAPGETPDPGNGDGPMEGGVLRASSADNTYDTFDADRTRFTPFAAILGYTNLGILEWDSFAETRITGAFAESWQTPDETTVVLTLRPGLQWHDKPPVNGRPAAADDMAFFIERNRQGVLINGEEDPNFYRKTAYANVESVEVTDENTVTVRFSQPDPFFLTTIAGQYAKVQAPEAVEQFENEYSTRRVDHIIGTGPYRFTVFNPEGDWEIVRDEGWQGVAYLDGVRTFPLFADEAARQGAFEQKQIDTHTPNQKANLDDLLARFSGQIFERPLFSANPMAGTYYGGTPPWSDDRLIGAIFRAIDRRALIDQMFQGRGVLSGNIPPTQGGFGISEEELITFPGYLEDRSLELTEAKAMWDAANGADLGTVTVDIPDIWEGAYSGVSSLITNQLQSALGNNFEARIEPYSTITTKIVQQDYGNGNPNIWYGWIEAIDSPEPSLGIYISYNSSTPNWHQFGVQVDEVDALTNQLIMEFDVEARAELTRQTVRHILEHYGMGIPYNMVNINNVLCWNYVHPAETASFVTQHLHHRQYWLDQNDPTWSGRPA